MKKVSMIKLYNFSNEVNTYFYVFEALSTTNL